MLKDLQMACRSLFKKGRHNGMKIVSLGVGLAVGLILIAKVYFEQSYDDFFPDKERIYMIKSVLVRDNKLDEWPNVSGAIAPGMKMEIPEVQVATRYTGIAYDATIVTPEKRKYHVDAILGDTCLFDVFPLPILIGDPKDILARPMYALISESLATRMGKNVVGQTFELEDVPGEVLTVGGIFRDIPENSHLDFNVLVSMPSIAHFTRDGSMNWVGNDRYRGYVKLAPGVQPKDMKEGILRMQEKNQPLAEMKQAGIDLSYTLQPMLAVHNGDKNVKRMAVLLSLLAFALLFTAIMNYILIVVSSIVNRSREVAVHKCYGASGRDIHRMVMSEALLHLFLSLVLAVGLIFLFRGTIQELLDASLKALFWSKGSLILLAICIVVLLTTGLVPGYLFGRIPVASAFRNFRENRRLWKLSLLFFQFIASGFLLTLLVVIGRQYTFMVNDSPGYAYDKLAYCELAGVDSTLRQKTIDEVMRLSEVAEVTTSTHLFFWSPSGNNVRLPGDERELFNIADMYWVGDGYLKMMEIPVIDGRSFEEGVTSSHEVMVSRSFVKKMETTAGWKDSPIGKGVVITEHSQTENDAFTICGVYEDFRLGIIGNVDERPTVMFYRHRPSPVLMVKFHMLTSESMRKVSETLKQLIPNKEVVLHAYRTEMIDRYQDSRRFRDAVMIGGIITLLISLIGLVGYTEDEVGRRRSEVAVRQVNGATLKDVLRLFLGDILRIALPALILGGCISYLVAGKWQEQFTEKIPLSWYIFIGCGCGVLAIILAVVCMKVHKASRENPVDCLRSE